MRFLSLERGIMSNKLDIDSIPEHIAIIMDGNGRWAKKRGARRIFGHSNAIKAVRDVTEGCAELGVKFLTLYAFSTENWARPKEEIDALMGLLVSTIIDEMPTLMKNGVKLNSIGDVRSLPEKAYKQLEDAKHRTSSNTGLTLVLALNYSGRWELTNAVKKLSEDVSNKKLDHDAINTELISNYLETAEFPDPELLIRTSGELRLSNFLLWQIAYTELYFTEVLWPDFRRQDLHEAIVAYQSRERRFGKTSEQIHVIK